MRSLATLADALVGLGLLERDGESYRNTAVASRYLDRASDDSRADVFLYTDNLWESWGQLTAVLRDGPASAAALWDDAALRNSSRAMHQGKPGAGRDLVEMLDLRGDEVVADLGGAPGTFGEAFALALPDGHVVLVDRGIALEEARTRLPEDLVEAGRVSLVEADLFESDLAALAEPAPGFDIAVLSSVTHLFGPDENRALLARVAEALVPGGLLVIRDFVMGEDAAGSLDAAMLSLTMLVTTPRGRCYSFGQYSEMLLATGFRQPRIRPMAGGAVMITAARA